MSDSNKVATPPVVANTALKYLGKVVSLSVSFVGIYLLVGGNPIGILFLLLGLPALWYFTRELKSSKLSRWILGQQLKIWRKINNG